ncbi:acyl carrier protein [Candidatus Haliotispira prima]|uniref:Acyl carrier protein n=1 Tax=Candidatus Haliotispira prima TaxID=3034016 RepID=A0ABY8MJI1_9SPIO|nr:acyl carrier protein [Candidatus Haliotispira prima]
MTKEELYDKLKALVVEKLEVEESKVEEGARFREDLGADSLDTYELLFAIQSELDIQIEDEKAAGFETVGDAYKYICEAKGF